MKEVDVDLIQNAISQVLGNNPEDVVWKKITELIKNNPIKFEKSSDIPDKSGVYLLYKKPFDSGKFIYVGESGGIRGRISGIFNPKLKKVGDKVVPKYHVFVKRLMELYQTKNQEELRKRVNADFRFSYVTTESKAIAFLIEEVMLIVYGDRLLNKFNHKKDRGRFL